VCIARLHNAPFTVSGFVRVCQDLSGFVRICQVLTYFVSPLMSFSLRNGCAMPAKRSKQGGVRMTPHGRPTRRTQVGSYGKVSYGDRTYNMTSKGNADVQKFLKRLSKKTKKPTFSNGWKRKVLWFWTGTSLCYMFPLRSHPKHRNRPPSRRCLLAATSSPRMRLPRSRRATPRHERWWARRPVPRRAPHRHDRQGGAP
jgi:hypothetical protein